MRLLTYNVRGLGQVDKKTEVKKLINSFNVNIAFIQETKLEICDSVVVGKCWPNNSFKWAAINSSGSSGGILTIWDKEWFIDSDIIRGMCWIIIKGFIPELNITCSFLNIYAPNSAIERKRLWEEIMREKAKCNNFWCMAGDFNTTRNIEEKRNATSLSKSMADFDEFISIADMADLPLIGRKYTWANSIAASRIDRIMFSQDWMLNLFGIKQWGLPYSLSDHCPVVCGFEEVNWGPKPIRVFDEWFRHPEFLNIVTKNWKCAEAGSNISTCMLSNLRCMRKEVGAWGRKKFGSVDAEIKKLADDINNIQLKFETSDLDLLDVARLKALKSLHRSKYLTAKRLWAQKSRVKWANFGDISSGYFHRFADSNGRRKNIVSIEINGKILTSPKEIKEGIFRHFNKHFSSDKWLRPSLDGVSFNKISPEEATNLEFRFSEAEIWDAISSCDGNKAPGPDGINLNFIKKIGNLLKETSCKFSTTFLLMVNYFTALTRLSLL